MEADVVCQIVVDLVDLYFVQPEEVIIISPYTGHSWYLRKKLESSRIVGVCVGSVDAFQVRTMNFFFIFEDVQNMFSGFRDKNLKLSYCHSFDLHQKNRLVF